MATITQDYINMLLDYTESKLTYIDIDDGVTPDRKATTFVRDDNTSVIDAFWDTTEANGTTYNVANVYFDGTATPETGDVAVTSAINVTKTTSQSLTVSAEITVEVV